MSVRYFDPKEFQITFAGFPLKDIASEFITVEYDKPRFKLVPGIDGDAAKVRNKLRSGAITLSVLQSSPSNNRLSEILLLDEISGLLSFPFMARDRKGGTVITCATTFIESFPSVTFGNSPQIRTWRLLSDNIFMYLGGNPFSNKFDGTNYAVNSRNAQVKTEGTAVGPNVDDVEL